MFKGAFFALGDGATQVAGVKVGPPENVKHLAHLLDGGLVRAAHNRQVAIVEAVALYGPGRRHRQGLKGLEGRANEGTQLAVARPRQGTAPVIAHGHMNPVVRLHDALPQKLHL